MLERSEDLGGLQRMAEGRLHPEIRLRVKREGLDEHRQVMDPERVEGAAEDERGAHAPSYPSDAKFIVRPRVKRLKQARSERRPCTSSHLK